MNKFIKILLVSIIIYGGNFSLRSLASNSLQYDSKTGVYTRKKAPELNQQPVEDTRGKNQEQIKSTPSSDLYKNYGVRTAIAEEAEAAEIIKNNPAGNPGHTLPGNYSVKKAPGASSNQSSGSYEQKKAPQTNQTGSTTKLGTTGQNIGGYSVRSIKVLEDRNKASVAARSQSQYDNAANSDYAYKKVDSKRNLNFGNLQETNKGRRSNSYYTNYYGDAIKIYNQRGQRISPSISSINRTVIIVPRQGITVTGIVTLDDPGRSITIKDPDGQNLTFQYTDMDALVNI